MGTQGLTDRCQFTCQKISTSVSAFSNIYKWIFFLFNFDFFERKNEQRKHGQLSCSPSGVGYDEILVENSQTALR
jgi:hypothetical protein